MKKVIALALTLAMVLALGVTAFAAAEIAVKETYEVGEETNFPITVLDGEKVTKVYDASGIITFGTPIQVDNDSTLWTVTAKMNAVGFTKIIVEYTDVNEDPQDNKKTAKIIEIVDADEPQAGEDYLTFAELGYTKEAEFIDAYYGYSSVVLNLVKTPDDPTTVENEYEEYDGISAEVYNATAKLSPEKIVLKTNFVRITLYRGDYTKLTVKKNLEINAMVAFGSEWELDKENMNNRVLTALGNNNADPYYVSIDTTNLTEVAANPELEICLDSDDFTQWCKTNNCKAMDVYSFDPADDTVALVAEDIAVNNLFDNVIEMPTLETGYYVLVDAGNSATGSANVKPNTNTGANDMVAVAVVFATIALAAGVSKKVR